MCEEYDDGYDEQAAAEEAAYQEMCDAGAFEQQALEGEAAAAEAEIANDIEREKIIDADKKKHLKGDKDGIGMEGN